MKPTWAVPGFFNGGLTLALKKVMTFLTSCCSLVTSCCNMFFICCDSFSRNLMLSYMSVSTSSPLLPTPISRTAAAALSRPPAAVAAEERARVVFFSSERSESRSASISANSFWARLNHNR